MAVPQQHSSSPMDLFKGEMIMSNQTKQENAEMTKTQITEEQPGNNQQTVETPVASLKAEQIEERANPASVIIC